MVCKYLWEGCLLWLNRTWRCAQGVPSPLLVPQHCICIWEHLCFMKFVFVSVYLCALPCPPCPQFVFVNGNMCNWDLYFRSCLCITFVFKMEYIYEIVHIYALFNVHLSIWNVVPVYLFVIVNLCIFLWLCTCVFFVIVCLCIFHMLLQMSRLLAWVIAFLASKWFLTSVGKHVSPQIAGSSARIITFPASKGFLVGVRKSVIFQSAWTSAREVALIASKRFFSRMLPHVCLENTSLVARIVALVTAELLHPWMCCHVLSEGNPFTERRDALVALETFFPWMSEQVPLEVFCSCAGIVALFVTKRLFSWMGSHVDSKVVSCWVVALWTNKGLLPWMSSYVAFKIKSCCTRVVALWTNKGFLSAVNSNVSFQLGGCIKRIAALAAIVSFLSDRVKIVDIRLSCHLNFLGFGLCFQWVLLVTKSITEDWLKSGDIKIKKGKVAILINFFTLTQIAALGTWIVGESSLYKYLSLKMSPNSCSAAIGYCFGRTKSIRLMQKYLVILHSGQHGIILLPYIIVNMALSIYLIFWLTWHYPPTL